MIKIDVGMSLEDYVECILVLSKRYSGVRSVQVAEQIGVSKASVCNAVRLLIKKELVTMDRKKLLYLTQKGMELDGHVYEKHCFFRELLVSCGVDENTATHDACRIEHAISDEAFEKLKIFLESKK